jgi:serine/threonine protein kinase
MWIVHNANMRRSPFHASNEYSSLGSKGNLKELIKRLFKLLWKKGFFFKPENILCMSNSGHRIKIIDFGLARRFNPSQTLKVLFGTPEFVAPEVVNFDKIGYGTDMWSVGVICYVL